VGQFGVVLGEGQQQHLSLPGGHTTAPQFAAIDSVVEQTPVSLT